MKQLFKILMATLFLASIATTQLLNAQNANTTSDSIDTPQYTDTTIGDTTVVSEVEEEDSSSTVPAVNIKRFDLFNGFEDIAQGGILMAIISIVTVFGFPFFALFIILYFRYKNRCNRYRVIEKAVEAGQPIPEKFLINYSPRDTRAKGVRNTFTGIGLLVFLWAITGSFAIGSVGILVICNGLAQLINARNQPPINNKQ